MSEPRRSYPGLESNRALINPFDQVVTLSQAAEYEDVRPAYPGAAYDLILAGFTGGEVALDVGAGTGQFTRGLVERGAQVIALEPSAAMRTVLGRHDWAQSLTVVDGTAEQTGLPADYVDLVVWAQCIHWLDVPSAATEAARVLRPTGTLAVVANQLDVSLPWVHRLSRIMRSGDVVRANRPPVLGESFSEPELNQVPWVQNLSVQEVLALARTRSSYLQATPPRQEKMQENLSWYLREHLGFGDEELVPLPYVTFVWKAGLTSRRAPRAQRGRHH